MSALLFLDIDGVLNPWAAPACPPGYAEHRWRRRKAWLSAAHGPALLSLTGSSPGGMSRRCSFPSIPRSG